MSNHTPGPWEAASREGDDWDSVVAIPGTPLEICQCFHERGNEEECEANARLIAASPELLEALKALCNYIDQEGPAAKEWQAISEWCEKGQAAIAKAEGAA